jgi:hypothetical protein
MTSLQTKEKKEGVLEYKRNFNAPPISSKRRKRIISLKMPAVP